MIFLSNAYRRWILGSSGAFIPSANQVFFLHILVLLGLGPYFTINNLWFFNNVCLLNVSLVTLFKSYTNYCSPLYYYLKSLTNFSLVIK